jgi:hypothetical protein
MATEDSQLTSAIQFRRRHIEDKYLKPSPSIDIGHPIPKKIHIEDKYLKPSPSKLLHFKNIGGSSEIFQCYQTRADISSRLLLIKHYKAHPTDRGCKHKAYTLGDTH